MKHPSTTTQHMSGNSSVTSVSEASAGSHEDIKVHVTQHQIKKVENHLVSPPSSRPSEWRSKVVSGVQQKLQSWLRISPSQTGSTSIHPHSETGTHRWLQANMWRSRLTVRRQPGVQRLAQGHCVTWTGGAESLLPSLCFNSLQNETSGMQTPSALAPLCLLSSPLLLYPPLTQIFSLFRLSALFLFSLSLLHHSCCLLLCSRSCFLFSLCTTNTSDVDLIWVLYWAITAEDSDHFSVCVCVCVCVSGTDDNNQVRTTSTFSCCLTS